MRDKQGLVVLGGIAALLLLLIKSAPASDTSGTFQGQPIIYSDGRSPWYSRATPRCGGCS